MMEKEALKPIIISFIVILALVESVGIGHGSSWSIYLVDDLRSHVVTTLGIIIAGLLTLYAYGK